MCSPEVKQSYIALSAFGRLGRPALASEVLDEMNEIALEVSGQPFDSMGETTVDSAFQELADGSLMKLDGLDRYSLTESGERLRKFQGKYVRYKSPNFPEL